MNRIILIFGILFTLTIGVNATTWFPVEHTCPICNQKSEYQEIGSWGGYIYAWPSKFQYVYWPLTDFPSVYCCPKCHFSTYMWDFDSIPENQIVPLKEYLSTVKLDKKYVNYVDIPMTTRLEIAENVYKILGRDKEFWCKFYRVIGYHYDREKNATKAKEARMTALSIAKEMLSDASNKGQEKEIFFIIAAMYNFINEKDSALIYLDKASLLTYQNDKLEEKNAKGLDEYLTGLIKQYKDFIRKENDDNNDR